MGRRKITSSFWLLMRSCWPNNAPIPSGATDRGCRRARPVCRRGSGHEDDGLAATHLQQRLHLAHLMTGTLLVTPASFKSGWDRHRADLARDVGRTVSETMPFSLICGNTDMTIPTGTVAGWLCTWSSCRRFAW